MIECAPIEARGSMGCQYIINAVTNAGYQIDLIEMENYNGGYDIELVSILSVVNYPLLKNMPKLAKLRIVGGHPLNNNPLPVLNYGDIFCIGEGEEWIIKILQALKDGCSLIDIQKSIKGTITKHWNGEVVSSNYVEEIPKNQPFLTPKTAGHSPTWNIEMSRGCKSKCHYCELGWSVKPREHRTEYLIELINNLDKKKSNRVSLFAPDESAHHGYFDCLKAISNKGMVTQFGSSRIDSFLKSGIKFSKNFTLRLGVDGLTERTRFLVKKNITNQSLLDYFEQAAEIEHTGIKLFMVFGYEWEKLNDFNEWEETFEKIKQIRRYNNVRVRLKFTPFIPNISTPLGNSMPIYHKGMVAKINSWLKQNKIPHQQPGVFIESDGCVMSEKSHAIQCALSQGDQSISNILDNESELIKWWGKYRENPTTKSIILHESIGGSIIPIEQIKEKAKGKICQMKQISC
jgi:hypothetical protein